MEADEEEEEGPRARVKKALKERSRSRSRGAMPVETAADKRGKKEVNKLSKQWRTQMRVGEADRHIPTLMPRHLNSGKTSLGSRSRR